MVVCYVTLICFIRFAPSYSNIPARLLLLACFCRLPQRQKNSLKHFVTNFVVCGLGGEKNKNSSQLTNY